MIDITLLGTSALMPTPERALTSATLFCHGRGILFDCGEGTQTAARKAGVSLMKTDVIALTHYHGDHIFGLPGLLQTMHCLGRDDPLYLIGPGDIGSELAPILRLAGETRYPISLIGIDREPVTLSDLNRRWPTGARLLPFKTYHRVPSRGYVFTLERAGRFDPEKAKALGIPTELWKKLQTGENVRADGRIFRPEDVLGEVRRGLKFAFTGDTAYNADIAAACAGADLMICEATYARDEDIPGAEERGHMVFSQAAQLASDAGARRIWLAHYSQQVEDPEAYLETATDIFENTVCGRDGMSIRLEFDP